MPEGDIGAGGEDGLGNDGGGKGDSGGVLSGGPEAIALPGAAPDDLPGGSLGEIVRVLQEQWRAERERANAAENSANDLRAKLAEAEALLSQSREALDAAERRRRIDQVLLEQEAVDLETARLMTEATVARMPERDVATAVADLRRSKPFLFRARSRAAAGAAMSVTAPSPDPAGRAAEEAVRTGDRIALLRYLRARRGG